MEFSPNCLFCKGDISFSSGTVENHNEAEIEPNKDLIFSKLCHLLQLEIPNNNNNCWKFQEEPFPFCKLCSIQILTLCNLYDQVQLIQQQMRNIVAQFYVLTIESQREKLENIIVVNDNDDSKGDPQIDITIKDDKLEAAKNKYENFRNSIIRRFKVKLVLTDCSKHEFQDKKGKIVPNINKVQDPTVVTTKDDDVNVLPEEDGDISNFLKVNIDVDESGSFCDNLGDISEEDTNNLEFCNDDELSPSDEEIDVNESPGKDPGTKNKKRKRLNTSHKSDVPKKRDIGRISMIDSASQTYVMDGFEFSATEDGRSYKCLTCSKLYNKGNQVGNKMREMGCIRKHIKTAHMHKYRGVCPICGEVKNNLTSHMAAAHPKNAQENICEICGKVYKVHFQLLQHLKSHVDPSEYEYTCEHCGKKFRQKVHLQNHITTHTGEKPFVCEVCGHRFNLKHVLAKHVASKHATIRPFACHLCNWTFGVRYLLARHIQQVHQGVKRPPKKLKEKATCASSSNLRK